MPAHFVWSTSAVDKSDKPSLCVLIFDTLRHDLFDIATYYGFDLPGFRALFDLAPFELDVWCGSFPTVPMRTDLLTGRLSFLDGRWERPAETDSVWLTEPGLSRSGTCHVGDSYMLWTPELGGYFEDYFDEITRLRGIGADPWHPVPVTRALDTVCRQARGAELEAQFRANVILGDAPTGVEGSRRLFCAALKEADRLPAGGILWVECFQPHEPWINLKCDPWGIPGYFRYGRVGLEVGKDEVTAQRHLYARRLVEIDTSLLDFASELRGTDFEILILSDHGIYLGDYGLFGKPKNEPLLPPVARLVCRTTLSVPHGTIGWVQPHELASLLLQKDGNAEVDAHADASLTRGKRFRVSGRNSPETNCIQVLCEEGICTFWRRPTDRCLLPWDGLDPGRDWRDNICREHPVLDEAALFVRSLFSGRERIEEFRI